MIELLGIQFDENILLLKAIIIGIIGLLMCFIFTWIILWNIEKKLDALKGESVVGSKK